MNPWFSPGVGGQARAAPARAGPGRGRGGRRRRALRLHGDVRRPLPGRRVPRLDGPARWTTPTSSCRSPTACPAPSAANPEAVAQMNGGVGRAGGVLGRHARRPAGRTRSTPTVDFVTMMSHAHARRRPDARRRHHRHHGHADARQPRHAEEPARLAAVAPRHPPRGPRPHRRRPVADPERRRGVPAGVPDRVDGPQGHPRRRLPRLPDEEGRHGPADDPGRHP